MFFIVLVFFLFIYLLISVAVLWMTVRWARKRGRSKWRWGILAALVMYHLVFWDLIPTYVVYKYYAITKAGFWVYKTPEKWKAENPGVAETLTWKERSDPYEGKWTLSGYKGYRLNERMVRIWKDDDHPIFNVGSQENLIVDSKNNEILSRQVLVASGFKGDTIKNLFLNFGLVNPGGLQFSYSISDYKEIGKEVK